MLKTTKKITTGLFTISLSALLLAACGEEEAVVEEAVPAEETHEEEPEAPEEAVLEKEADAVIADDAHTWLKDAGLVAADPEDVTAEFEGSEGLVRGLRTPEVDIMEYETEAQASNYHNPDLNSYAVGNIFLLIKQGEANAENFVKVVESKGTFEGDVTADVSAEQQAVAEAMTSGADFLPTVEAYFQLPDDQKSAAWDSFMSEKPVTWSGIIADLEAIGDSIVVYGGEGYNGEDWTTISTEKPEMMPYTFIVELNNEADKAGLQAGDSITLNGNLSSRGDKELQYNWKLYSGEVVE